MTLPGAGQAAGHVRRFVRDMLDGTPALDDVQICVNEAFANAVEHTASGRGGKVTVLLAVDGGRLVAEVTDDGAGGARPAVRKEPLGEDGRGLRMIDALALGWGVRADGDRTTVWMRFPAGPPVSRP
ncbi:ATP-binding protein [Actinomadura parmotrematis]|uniref:ATP-binding protein n=1 Tax=Actinomadura parmotrematis TaxID=2864039 RepID=A0ABS7FL97_9ACTN|nr:ATP-binding protein [Actinomadura parmotrematis]MBW8481145.1 ATP-binding protein [Actinomadura parmotrematis]